MDWSQSLSLISSVQYEQHKYRLTLSFKIWSLRLHGKVGALYNDLDKLSDDLESFQTAGVLDGFSKEPLDYASLYLNRILLPQTLNTLRP